MVNPAERFKNRIEPLCSHGYGAGFDFQNGIPQHLSVTFPQDWMMQYQSLNLAPRDPVIRWGMENEGHRSWEELADAGYPSDVFDLARQHGLENGTAVSVVLNQRRAIVGVTHKEKCIDNEFLSLVYGELCIALSTTPPPSATFDKNIQFLQLHSQGLTEQNIADRFDLSIQSVRARRKSAIKAYGAMNVAQAVKIAMQRCDIR